MSTITLPNIRVSSDLTVKVRLKDSGVAIDWSTLNNVKASIYSDAQRALAGRCDVSIDAEDPTLLVCQYAANKPQYVGVNRIVVSAKYHGETKTYDKPAFSFVRWTGDQAGEQITIDDPDVDVEIDVEDVSSSILDEAIRAAFAGAERANDAADSLADVEADVEAAEALRVAAEESRVEAEEDRVEAEAARVDEEAVRVSAEDARVVAENAREAAEDLREGAEDDRAAAETARETAEAARVAAEALRVSAEGSRESAEAARASQASTDHTTAASDHTQAAADHTQAAADHTTAASDHTQASSDHTLAAADHTTAAADHTQAQADHAVMEGYDDRLDSVEGEVSQLEAKVVEKNPGKNIYDNVLQSGYFLADGTIDTSTTNSHTVNYLPVEPNTNYYLSRNGGGAIAYGSYLYGVWYDSDKVLISTFVGSLQSVTSPANARFLRVSVRNEYNNQIQIEKGNARTAYVAYNPVGGYPLEDDVVSLANINDTSFDAEPTIGSSKISRSGGIVTYADRELVKVGCKNIYDGVIESGYLMSNGNVDSSSVNYHTVNYLPVLPNTQYHISRKNNGVVAVGATIWLCYYDSAKNLISSEHFSDGNTGILRDFTTPANCYYIRTTIRLEYNDEVQIELGNARTAYVPYNPIYNYLGSVRKLENDIKQVSAIIGSDADTIAYTSEIIAGTTMELPNFPTRLKKRLAISFRGDFAEFVSVSIGQNYKKIDGAGIKIDGTNVYAMDYAGGSESVRQTVAHGIASFSTFISVSLYIDATQCAFVTIATGGGFARVKLNLYNYAHSGTVFANVQTAMTKTRLNATCADFRNPVWAFGDSYFGLSIVRVGYWLRANGFFNILFDGLSGENATGAMSDLNLCLNFGTPKYIVWALGMNNAPDNGDQPNATWLQKTNELITICEAKGINPIFCTIPSVPNIVHEALSAWVRNSGYRYIDVAKAVGSQADGTWYDGMLSSDNVHPTEFGAKVIAQRWLIDFPEIMEYGIVSPSGENTMITV